MTEPAVRGDTSGALSTFKDSLASNPGYPPTYRGLGLVYEKMGNKPQAKRAFSRYLQLSPGARVIRLVRVRRLLEVRAHAHTHTHTTHTYTHTHTHLSSQQNS